MKIFDLVVLGSGPGGYIAAARAGQLGLQTAIVEKDLILGGTCLHRGCIPTKFLLHAAEQYNNVEKIKKIGINCRNINLNWEKIQVYKNNILKKNAYGVKHVVSSNHVKIFFGIAQICNVEKKEIKILNKNNIIHIHTKNIIIATGSSAKRNFLDIMISGYRIMNSDDILNIKVIPDSLSIIGGGVIGCEFASIFSNFNTDITILENSKNILAMLDKDCREQIIKIFTKKISL